MKTVRAYGVRAVAAAVLVAALVSVVAGLAAPPVMASAAQERAPFQSLLDEAAPSEKVLARVDRLTEATVARKKTATPVAPKPAAATYRPGTAASASATKAAATAKPSSSGNDALRAQAILAGYIARYPILQGATVTFGDAHGYQAICYYKSGRIVVSPTHTASLEKILAHEVWHIIDWRDNGTIDWGENVPPR